jgi:hypothetical protein
VSTPTDLPAQAPAEPSEQRIAEIAAREAKATKPPWRVDDESWKEVNDITVWCGPVGDEAECVCNMGAPFVAVGNREEAEVSYANGVFVAHARADIPWLLSQLAARDAEIGRLTAEREGQREALEFYADPANWKMKAFGVTPASDRGPAEVGSWVSTEIEEDDGETARAALAASPPSAPSTVSITAGVYDVSLSMDIPASQANHVCGSHGFAEANGTCPRCEWDRRIQDECRKIIAQRESSAPVAPECDHPWHRNPALIFPCPACGAGDDQSYAPVAPASPYKSAHTRGDWESRPTLNTNTGAFEIVCRGKTLAFVQGNDLGHTGGNQIPFETAKANGRVMAAAPELLVACELALELCDGGGGPVELACREAIGKAVPRE